MKKILLTSTAMIFVAGAAAAQVSVSGDGRMGVLYESYQDSGEKFSFNSRLRITFTAEGQTDGGLNFGGSIRADNAVTDGTAGHVFISGEFGRISMGDVAGAPEYVVGDLHMTSLTGLSIDGMFDANETLFLSNGGIADGLWDPGADQRPAMRYDYEMSGFTFALSADNPGSAVEGYGLSVAYDAGMFGAALGYERLSDGSDRAHQTIAALTASVDGVADFKAIYGRISGSNASSAAKQYGISAESTFDATTVSGFVRRLEEGPGKIDIIGVGASHDLGGGAALTGGVSRVKVTGSSSETIADFGVSMSF